MDDGRNTEAEREASRLWRAWRTAHEMVADRGYVIAESEYKLTLDEFRQRFGDPTGYVDRKQLAFSAGPSDDMKRKHYNPRKPNETIGNIWIEFNGDQNIGVKQLRNFGHTLNENQFSSGIFITAVPVTGAAQKIIPSLHPLIMEIFMEQDLLVNITHHELVPKHVLLSAEEKAALLQRYRLKESQLPRIQQGDPVARYLGLRRGQVVKIIRKSETAGRYASYRWVI
ncbi:putative rna polymerase subunit protein [Lasiodiplodia theobromae]|uniref:DNA-directed RNA polymerases I, II, and III subunit RPABC1 n=2 Tax=Lasiodiplodia TaxID=66739 RepID=A0A5N5DQ78_9PEZI|nr:RNA polymerase subunit [Lasiodiplodia theobromae]KAB2579897.1 DNA-directed RNA polymerases I and III subunit RPABC1 [Lasiodiplodia theobromae]KAF4541018.1 RNA polymerase subunit [Lasiodiplodia theobromae]KAF9634499.1 putative rna polymerase subunit protein [Lasiodiplodia theobromae]KAK0660390.1 DNA-directed RNA polymerases I [Lasiodiplodia hormozganensis]